MEQNRASAPSAANDVSSRNRESTATGSRVNVLMCQHTVRASVLIAYTITLGAHTRNFVR